MCLMNSPVSNAGCCPQDCFTDSQSLEKITSISVHKDNFIATSFGPSPKLLFSPADFASSPMVIIQPKKATDVWSSLLLPTGGVVLG